jgi:hypothetical protein
MFKLSGESTDAMVYVSESKGVVPDKAVTVIFHLYPVTSGMLNVLVLALTVPVEVFAGLVPSEALSTVSAVTENVIFCEFGRLGLALRDHELTPGKDESYVPVQFMTISEALDILGVLELPDSGEFVVKGSKRLLQEVMRKSTQARAIKAFRAT